MYREIDNIEVYLPVSIIPEGKTDQDVYLDLLNAFSDLGLDDIVVFAETDNNGRPIVSPYALIEATAANRGPDSIIREQDQAAAIIGDVLGLPGPIYVHPICRPLVRGLTAQQVADQFGVSVGRVRQLAQQRKVGQRFGPSLMFSPSDVELLRPKSVGRPKKN